MSIRLKLFLSHFLVIVLPIIVIGNIGKTSIENNFLQKTEASMTNQADLFARFYSRAVEEGRIKFGEIESNFDKVAKDLAAEKHPDLPEDATREQICFKLADSNGVVFYDAENGKSVGENISKWRDFKRALQTGYGARTTLNKEKNAMFMHITLPIKVNGEVMGVASVSRSTTSIMQVIHLTKRNLFNILAVAMAFAIIIAYIVTHYITTPLKKLTAQAQKISAGELNVNIELPLRDEVGELSRSFAEMTRELEGKNYIEQFVSDVSHELKAPLTALKGSTELLLDDDIEEVEIRRKFLRNIHSETERLIDMVNGLLVLSKLDSRDQKLSVEKCDISTVAARVTDNFGPHAAKQNVKLILKCEDDVIVKADPKKIEQVFINLLSNAITYAGENGEVKISTFKKNGHASFTVADSGLGIAPENIGRIYDRFYTTAKPGTRQKGTGLGLAIVKKIVDAHNARIEVSSEPNKGTSFTVSFSV